MFQFENIHTYINIYDPEHLIELIIKKMYKQKKFFFLYILEVYDRMKE